MMSLLPDLRQQFSRMRPPWKFKIAALIGLLISQVGFIFFGILITLHAMKYNFLQVNDWSAYIVFLFIAYGLPFAFFGCMAGIVCARLRNRVTRQ
jgi:hypothetical protein